MNDIVISDIGGRKAGAIDRHSHAPTSIERHIDAMMMLLMRPNQRTASGESNGKRWNVDELRRAMEELLPEFYEGSAYYERWVSAMRDLMVEKNIVSSDDITAKIDAIRSRQAGKEEP